MTTDKALAILDDVVAAYETRNRRDVVIVLRAARELLAEHGLPGEQKSKRKPK